MNSCLEALVVGLLVSSCLAQVDYEDGPVVTTTLGRVEGKYGVSRGNRTFKQFVGMPYAKSPTGKRRFMNPEPREPWRGVLDAKVECDQCAQQFLLLQAVRYTVQGDEDCLCINVFTPSVDLESSSLPVIVFFYGGQHLGGSSNTSMYGPELMMDRDVVLVTLNFREGILGKLRVIKPLTE